MASHAPISGPSASHPCRSKKITAKDGRKGRNVDQGSKRRAHCGGSAGKKAEAQCDVCMLQVFLMNKKDSSTKIFGEVIESPTKSGELTERGVQEH